MAESYQSRRQLFVTIALMLLLAGAFIILRPRLWVKNKTAKVIVDGRLSEDVKLFHGSDGRVLFYIKQTDRGDGDPFLYNVNDGIHGCFADRFLRLKIITIAKQSAPYCADFYGEVKSGAQSVEFQYEGQDIVVSWQAAPR